MWARVCLSVSVGAHAKRCVCVCACVCSFISGGKSFPIHFRSPYGKTKVLVSTIKGMEGALSSFSSYFF